MSSIFKQSNGGGDGCVCVLPKKIWMSEHIPLREIRFKFPKFKFKLIESFMIYTAYIYYNIQWTSDPFKHLIFPSGKWFSGGASKLDLFVLYFLWQADSSPPK